MNTIIPFIEVAAPTAGVQSGIVWSTSVLIALLFITFIIFWVRRPKAKERKDLINLFTGVSAALLSSACFLWLAIGFTGELSQWKTINTVTIEKIEENLDVKLTFIDTSTHRIACSEDLDDSTIDSVSVEHDSDKYLVTLTSSKNDDGTCTYELKPYKYADNLFESTDKK